MHLVVEARVDRAGTLHRGKEAQRVVDTSACASLIVILLAEPQDFAVLGELPTFTVPVEAVLVSSLEALDLEEFLCKAVVRDALLER